MKNYFRTKSFLLTLTTLVGSAGVVLIDCLYDHRYPTKAESLTFFGLLCQSCWNLIARVDPVRAFTPKGVYGPDPPSLPPRNL